MTEGGQVRIRAGMQDLHTVLHPGESIRSPRILQLHWQDGDAFRACNLFRRTMLAHIMPRIDGQLVLPLEGPEGADREPRQGRR